MTANELTAGMIFTTVDRVKVLVWKSANGSEVEKEISGCSAGDLRFRAIDGETVLAELAHFPGAKVILPATAKVSRK